MNKKIIWLIVVTLIIGATWFYSGQQEAVNVRLVAVNEGPVDFTTSNTRAGTIKACQRSRLSLPMGGQIAELFVREGEHVKKGQILIRLWNNDQKARLADAKAKVAMARSAVIESCRMAALNQRERERLSSLAAKKLVSAEHLDSATTKALVSMASCHKATASQKSMQALMDLQTAILEKTELTAPFSGVIAEINGEVGEYITPSPSGVATPPAVDLIADDCLYVSAPVDEVDAAKIKKGMLVNVTLDAFRGEAFNGQVIRIAPYVKELEKQARTVDVDVKLLDKAQQHKLLIGYSADIDVIIEQKKATLRLPTETIIDGDHVLVYEPNSGTLVSKKITIGLSNWRFSEIKEGLSEGDQVLLSLDVEGAIDGALVTVEE
ncbi:MAG: efflux RND transporter periplasmic adaptor subunit [Cycloclasticus sp.]|nr:efflux RND transporter periplasmic adaptor subunit [Cycloclasticus sp.]